MERGGGRTYRGTYGFRGPSGAGLGNRSLGRRLPRCFFVPGRRRFLLECRDSRHPGPHQGTCQRGLGPRPLHQSRKGGLRLLGHDPEGVEHGGSGGDSARRGRVARDGGGLRRPLGIHDPVQLLARRQVLRRRFLRHHGPGLETASGRSLGVFPIHSDYVFCCAFSADSRWLISGGWSGAVKLLEIGSWKVVDLPGHADYVLAAGFLDSDRKDLPAPPMASAFRRLTVKRPSKHRSGPSIRNRRLVSSVGRGTGLRPASNPAQSRSCIPGPATDKGSSTPIRSLRAARCRRQATFW